MSTRKPQRKLVLPESEDDEDVAAIIVFEQWPISRVQELDALLQTWLTQLGDSVDGPTCSKVHQMLSGIPDAAIAFDGLQELKEQSLKKTTLSRAKTEFILNAVRAMTGKLLDVQERQSSGGRGSSTNAGQDNLGAASLAVAHDAHGEEDKKSDAE